VSGWEREFWGNVLAVDANTATGAVVGLVMVTVTCYLLYCFHNMSVSVRISGIISVSRGMIGEI